MKKENAFCEHTNRYYNNDQFPKKCTTCLCQFEDRSSFLASTSKLMKGSYSIGPQSSVLEYRNCKCGSTLTLKMFDERKYDEKSNKQREFFRQRIPKLIKKGYQESEAKDIVMKEWNELSDKEAA
tara:strand:+ start:224464 stop:224838 length:375 start_codon:yes stop_codon:yes gene_type:complete